MKSKYYGQNFTSTDAVVEKLAPYLLNNPELHWAVLLDSAFDYESGAKPDVVGNQVNCYSGLDDLDDLCPGQVFSHMPIGCLIADFCSKALGGKLPSLECSRWLL